MIVALPLVDWDAQVRRHHRRVVVSLLARGIPLDRAEEVAQETWTRLIERHRDGELPRVALPGLAIAQARFLALDATRAASRHAARHAALGPADPPDDAVDPADPEAALVARDALDRARRELDQCPASARRVFDRVYAHPTETHADAAAALGLSVQRVRQVLCEVRKRLRDALERSP